MNGHRFQRSHNLCERLLTDTRRYRMDELLYNVNDKVKNFAVTYLVDITKVSEFNKMYELYVRL